MPDPDLDITAGGGRGGGGFIKTLRKGGGGPVCKKCFRPFGPQFGLKIREEGAGPGSRAPPLDPPLRGLYFRC